MFSIRSFLLTLFLLLLSLDLGAANRFAVQRRADSSAATSATTPASVSSTNPPLPPLSSSTNGESSTVQSSSTIVKSTSLSTASASSTQLSASKTLLSTSSSVITASTPSVSIFNATLTPDDLPITPDLTPGFAVTGTLLLVSGVVYTFVGIRNKWLQISFSTAYLASLAVTVLIIYVMELPVSNGLQGAYVVAITLTGLILGGAALLLMEMTEGLGCLFGGFCLAMWLLVLQPGGLLTSTASIVVFIVCFTIAGWVTSFSRYTRPYGLICLTSFGGATVVVLGIDCFTKSGLKEFWVYIWNLNQNLFPLGATTYPLTKGMKVEIFVIIILFLAGMASQSKLWNVIKKRRERRALDRLHDERNLRQEEEKVGRRIERANSRQRVYWEAVYGNKDHAPSGNSEIGSMVKEGHGSTVTSTEHSGERPIEMDEISSPPLMTGAIRDLVKKGSESTILVKVVADQQSTLGQPENQVPVGHDTNRLSPNPNRSSARNSQLTRNDVEVPNIDGSGAGEQAESKRNSKNNPHRASGGPAVVPLPFKIPEGDCDDSSSVATFADDDRFTRRFSQGSELLRCLSHRSQIKRDALSRPLSTSTEMLVGHHGIEDDRSSVAATVDETTDDGDSRSLPDISEHASREHKVNEDMLEDVVQDGIIDHNESSNGSAITISPIQHQPQAHVMDSMASQSSATEQNLEMNPQIGEEQANSPPSVTTVPEQLPVALTKEVLPPALPKVASSYRTNEWAKHLSNADAPEVEDIKLFQRSAEADSIPVEEPAVVHVKDLQKTPEIGVTPPAPRSTSQLSSYPFPPQTSRTNSYQPFDSSKADPTVVPWPQALISRSSSYQSLQRATAQQSQPIRSYRNSSTPNISQTSLVESPIEDTPGPLPSGSSLIGKRETMLRNKSSLAFNSLAATPEAGSRDSSEIRSNKIRDSQNEDEEMASVSARRSVVRQSTLPTLTPQLRQNPTFDSHQPRRQSSTPVNGPSRDNQLAQWRASVQQDLKANVQPKKSLDKSRSALLQEKMIAERQKEMEQAKKGMRENVLDERMRKGDMLEAHREAMRRMQKEANKHV